MAKSRTAPESPTSSESQAGNELPRSYADFVFGINLWVWAVLAIMAAPTDERSCLVRWCIGALHAFVGVLFFLRRPALRVGKPGDLAWAALSIVLSGLAFSHAPPCNAWPAVSQNLFVAGTGLAILSLASLGRNFAIFPAVRGVCATGPYRIVRHPVYAGELLLVVACFLARMDPLGFSLLLACAAALVVRVRSEESLLNSTADSAGLAYASYCKDVRFRFIPGVW